MAVTARFFQMANVTHMQQVENAMSQHDLVTTPTRRVGKRGEIVDGSDFIAGVPWRRDRGRDSLRSGN